MEYDDKVDVPYSIEFYVQYIKKQNNASFGI